MRFDRVVVPGILAMLAILAGCERASSLKGTEAVKEAKEAAEPRVAAPVRLPEGCLIGDGACAGVIVLADEASPMEREAAERLGDYLKGATGVAIPILRESEASPEEGVIKVYVGQTAALRQRGMDIALLPAETYGVWREGRALFLFGKDEEAGVPWMQSGGAPVSPGHWSLYRTPATKWAVNEFAAQELKVRWLWPGRLGTYIPPKEGGVFLPPEGKRLMQPPLERRAYMAKWRLVTAPSRAGFALLPPQEQETLQREGRDWMEDHLAGNRSPIYFGHSFSHWWEKYGAMNPDLFAEVPPGAKVSQPFPNENRVKLRLANPAVIDVIEEEYRAAGMPPTWPISPNDGSGFDTSEATMAWDNPPGQDKLAIWRAQGKLTARYVRFWNEVYERLSALNPDVALSVMAYSSYREPPEPGSVKARLALAVVNNYKGEEAFDHWLRWSQEAKSLMLRPNWWHVGVHAPYLEPLAQGEYLRFAGKHGLSGFTIDSLHGYWATQGLNYYVVARMAADPSRDPEALVGEYCEAFGPAANEVRAYFDYWMKESAAINFAGAISIHSAGKGAGAGEYQEVARKQGLHNSILIGSFRAIPLLYGDGRLENGLQLLERARVKAASDAVALQRVEYLLAGLQEFRATRDLLEIGYSIKEKRRLDRLPEFRKKEAELRDLRRELTRSHTVWGESIYENEIRRRIPTTVEALGREFENMDGL